MFVLQSVHITTLATTVIRSYSLRSSTTLSITLPVTLSRAILRRLSTAMEDPSIAKTLAGKYPAKDHCRRVVSFLQSQNASTPTHFYLEAAKTRRIEDKDQDVLFHQRRHFFYLTGCELPDAAFVYDVKNDKSTLFIPPVDPEEVIWSGMPPIEKEALERYLALHTNTPAQAHVH